MLDHVCRYFGEKVAFYFAWLGESCLLQSSPWLSQGMAPSASWCGVRGCGQQLLAALGCRYSSDLECSLFQGQ